MSRSTHPFFAKNPHIMGIVNVTPDSFSDGGLYFDPDRAIEHGLRLIAEGADSLDIGGESTRPGAVPVSVKEEIARIIPVIEGLRGRGVLLSVDTRNAPVMEAALRAGVDILNDVSGFTHDPRSVSVLAAAQVPAVVMHMQNDPLRMQNNPIYTNVIDDISDFFEERFSIFRQNRIENNLLVFDPGIGFGKNDEHNLTILRYIKVFQRFGVPIMLGTSRKSFIGRLSASEEVTERLGGSLASAIWGLSQGVQFFRVHDVAQTRQAFKIFQAIQSVSA